MLLWPSYLLQVDEDITVGVEAFCRIAPAVPIIANVIISENLFEVLVTSTGGRLHFFIYDKYLSVLERYRDMIAPAITLRNLYGVFNVNTILSHVKYGNFTYYEVAHAIVMTWKLIPKGFCNCLYLKGHSDNWFSIINPYGKALTICCFRIIIFFTKGRELNENSIVFLD